jgi:cholesterol oxidase
MLERGKEWVPGTFPSKLPQLIDESIRNVFGRNKRSVKNPLGLIDLRQGDDISVMAGSGLGGTSLLNANVTIRPDRDVFAQLNWPTLLKNRDALEPYFDLVTWELGSQHEPLDYSSQDADTASRRRKLARLWCVLRGCCDHRNPRF